MKRLLAIAAVLLALAGPALAQTNPNLIYGQVPTAAQWNALFASKQDYTGSAPCPVNGCVMAGPLTTVASTPTSAGFNVTPGVAPTAPNDGDIWTTTSGIFVQISGSTLGPLLGGVQAANTILGNGSGTGVPVALAIPSCSGAANGLQWVTNTGFQCGTLTAAASSIAVGTTTVSGGTIGNVFVHAASNLLGELTTSGTGTTLALAAGATLTTATITAPTISAPVLSGTITGTYTIGGTPSIPGSAINSGTVSGSFLAAINLGSSGNGGVTGTAAVANGGTGATTATAAIANLMPTPTRAGDIALWTGSAWSTLAGNNSGTQVLQETSSGVASWATVAGTGTMTSAAVVSGSGISLSGTCSSTSVLNCTVSASVPHPQGRITLAANVPVMKPTSCSGAACANQTTLRYDCGGGAGGGAGVPYFNGSIDLVDPIASCEVTDAMVAAASAGQVVSGNVYDVWWVHGGANRICVAMSSSIGGGGGWASDTGGSNVVRGTGFSQLDAVTRPYITNKNAITDCFNGSSNYGSVSANQGTYLGSIYANGNGQVSYVFPAIGSPPTAGLFGVYNAYNRVTTSGTLGESVGSYTYNSATIRECNADTTYIVQFVQGLQEDAVTATNLQNSTTASTGVNLISGIGLDATNVFFANGLVGRGTSNPSESVGVSSSFSSQLLGFHTLSCNEAASATGGGAVTMIGNGAAGTQTGMNVTLRN